MKNFKLLLATTAILSMVAMGANAESLNAPTVSIPARVQMIYPIKLIAQQGFDFGIIDGTHSEGNPEAPVVVVDTFGLYNSGTTAHIYDTSALKQAIVLVREYNSDTDAPPADRMDLVFPSEPINLTYKSGGNDRVCGNVSNFVKDYRTYSVTSGGYTDQVPAYYIGAKFTATDGGSSLGIPQECTGTVTATLVVTPGDMIDDGKD